MSSFYEEQLPPPTSIQAVFGILYGIEFIVYGIAVALFVRRRKMAIIGARNPYALLVAYICATLNCGINQAIRLYYPDLYCDEYWMYFLMQAGILGVLSVAIWRALVLIVKCDVQRLRLAVYLQSQGFEPPIDGHDPNNFFIRHATALTSRWILLVLTLYSVLVPLLRVTVPSFYVSIDATCHFSGEFVVPVMCGVLGIALCVLAWKIRLLEEDGFFIKREMTWQAAMAIIHFVMYSALVYGYPPFDHSAAAHLYNVSFYAILFYPTFAVPLYYSYYPFPKSVSRKMAARKALGGATGANGTGTAGATSAATTGTTAASGGTGGGPDPPSRVDSKQISGIGGSSSIPDPEVGTFQGLLASKPGRQSFQMHLVKEFSLEMLMFIDRVHEFHALRRTYLSDPTAVTVEHAKSEAQSIYSKFVAPGAPFEVTLSWPIAKPIHDVFVIRIPVRRPGQPSPRVRRRRNSRLSHQHAPSTTSVPETTSAAGKTASDGSANGVTAIHTTSAATGAGAKSSKYPVAMLAPPPSIPNAIDDIDDSVKPTFARPIIITTAVSGATAPVAVSTSAAGTTSPPTSSVAAPSDPNASTVAAAGAGTRVASLLSASSSASDASTISSAGTAPSSASATTPVASTPSSATTTLANPAPPTSTPAASNLTSSAVATFAAAASAAVAAAADRDRLLSSRIPLRRDRSMMTLPPPIPENPRSPPLNSRRIGDDETTPSVDGLVPAGLGNLPSPLWLSPREQEAAAAAAAPSGAGPHLDAATPPLSAKGDGSTVNAFASVTASPTAPGRSLVDASAATAYKASSPVSARTNASPSTVLSGLVAGSLADSVSAASSSSRSALSPESTTSTLSPSSIPASISQSPPTLQTATLLPPSYKPSDGLNTAQPAPSAIMQSHSQPFAPIPGPSPRATDPLMSPNSDSSSSPTSAASHPSGTPTIGADRSVAFLSSPAVPAGTNSSTTSSASPTINPVPPAQTQLPLASESRRGAQPLSHARAAASDAGAVQPSAPSRFVFQPSSSATTAADSEPTAVTVNGEVAEIRPPIRLQVTDDTGSEVPSAMSTHRTDALPSAISTQRRARASRAASGGPLIGPTPSHARSAVGQSQVLPGWATPSNNSLIASLSAAGGNARRLTVPPSAGSGRFSPLSSVRGSPRAAVPAAGAGLSPGFGQIAGTSGFAGQSAAFGAGQLAPPSPTNSELESGRAVGAIGVSKSLNNTTIFHFGGNRTNTDLEMALGLGFSPIQSPLPQRTVRPKAALVEQSPPAQQRPLAGPASLTPAPPANWLSARSNSDSLLKAEHKLIISPSPRQLAMNAAAANATASASPVLHAHQLAIPLGSSSFDPTAANWGPSGASASTATAAATIPPLHPTTALSTAPPIVLNSTVPAVTLPAVFAVPATGAPADDPVDVMFYLSLFDDALHEIEDILEQGAYQRYVVSPLYAQLLANLQLQRSLRQLNNQMSGNPVNALNSSKSPKGSAVRKLSQPSNMSHLSHRSGASSPHPSGTHTPHTQTPSTDMVDSKRGGDSKRGADSKRGSRGLPPQSPQLLAVPGWGSASNTARAMLASASNSARGTGALLPPSGTGAGDGAAPALATAPTSPSGPIATAGSDTVTNLQPAAARYLSPPHSSSPPVPQLPLAELMEQTRSVPALPIIGRSPTTVNLLNANAGVNNAIVLGHLDPSVGLGVAGGARASTGLTAGIRSVGANNSTKTGAVQAKPSRPVASMARTMGMPMGMGMNMAVDIGGVGMVSAPPPVTVPKLNAADMQAAASAPPPAAKSTKPDTNRLHWL